MVTAKDAILIYNTLSTHNIRVWLTGGWGIDALLEEQTRPHKDLDVIILQDNVRGLCEILARDGYRLHQLWSENRWVVDSKQDKIPTAFVLQDPNGRQLDAHAMVLEEAGNGIPSWTEADDLIFLKQDLAAVGRIGGIAVRCITPEMQMRVHAGYPLPEAHRRDLVLLHERFGIAYPEDFDHSSSRHNGGLSVI